MAMQVIAQIKDQVVSSMPPGTELEMGKTGWMSMVKNELENSPIASNVFIGAILVSLEKVVEMDFACPCKDNLNALFSAAYFLVPAVLVFLLKVNVHGTQCGKQLVSSLVPAILWFSVMFLDGHYFACAMTDWSGSYEIIEDAAPQKWCEPANNILRQKYKNKTQEWYSLSQAIGMGHIILLGLVFKVSGIVPQKTGKGEGKSSTQDEDPEAPETKKDEREGKSSTQDKDPEAPEQKKHHDKDGSESIELSEMEKKMDT